jgi:homeobox-leucine zipper protein
VFFLLSGEASQGSNPNQSNVLFLQESCTDACGSVIVYAPVDYSTLNMVLQGEDPALIRGPMAPPSGFVILPDGPELLNEMGDTAASTTTSSSASTVAGSRPGSVLTVSIQIAVSHVPPSGKLNMESVATISNIIINTVQHIRAALQRADATTNV